MPYRFVQFGDATYTARRLQGQLLRLRTVDVQVFVGFPCHAAAPGRAGQEADLHQIRLVDILQRDGFLSDGGGQRLQAHRSSTVVFNDGAEHTAVRYNRLIGSNVRKNDIVEIRGIKIDKTARRVWINGEEKTFTTKEFDLLTFLAQNPNHVFTKEELFSKIWDMESIGDIATVTVHIKKIREKIEFNTAKPQYIETIWGVGYRFKV